MMPQRFNVSRMSREAAQTNNILQMEKVLEHAATGNTPYDVIELLQRALREAAKYNHKEMLQFLLDHGADITTMPTMLPDIDDERANTETLQFLLDHGWDINKWFPDNKSLPCPFLWNCLQHQDIVDWSLDHGARVDIFDERLALATEDGFTEGSKYLCPPILDQVARYGTVAQFELFRSRGAPLGFRMLHNAVQRASYAALPDGVVEPDTNDDSRFTAYKESMRMVKYLLRLNEVDVNEKKFQVGDMCSTPLCYVALRGGTKQDFGPLTRLILNAGADADLVGHSQRSPRFCGRGNESFIKALKEWENNS